MNDPIGASERSAVFSRAAVRHVVFGELAVLAGHLNEFCYESAIRANRVQGWLLRQRDAR